MRTTESLVWCGVWTGLAMLFNVGIFLFYPRGTEAGLEFFTGYLVEESLSIDNILVFLVLFGYFKLPRAYQHKVLFWGVAGALIFRAIFIVGGLTLIARFQWLIYLLGAFLVMTGISVMRKEDAKEIEPEKNWVIRTVRRFFPVSEQYERDRFFTRKSGKICATPLLVALIAIESTDIVFASDSIPAVFAITPDSFIVFSSNIFAMLGIRALYFAVAGFVQSFYFLHYGFASILVILGVKMLLGHVVQLPIALSLVVIVFILLLCVIVSLLRPRQVDLKDVFARTARLGLIPFRRLLFIENIIDHGKLAVREVMRERSSVSVMRLDAPWAENLRMLRETRFSRYPIVNGEDLKPLGVLHVKDLALADATRPIGAGRLKELAQPGLEMPEDLSLTNALARFRHRAHQMGIIVDANGMWTGIVTIEDLIEQMIGEIDDESAFSRDEAPVSLADALSPARIVLELHASSMIEAIEKIVHSIPREELPTDAQTILRALTERAEQMTNYFGGGVAATHAHLDGIDKPTLAFGRSDEGVELGAANQRAEIFFLAISPSQTPNMQVQLLASIARLIESEYVLNRLRKAKTPEELIETIRAGEQVLPA